jgi:uncharacterized protein YjbJ (UPF0337 family)
MGELSKKFKGRVKQGVGGLTGDRALQREGEDDVRAGQVEGAVLDVKHAVTGAVKDAKHAFKEITK